MVKPAQVKWKAVRKVTSQNNVASQSLMTSRSVEDLSKEKVPQQQKNLVKWRKVGSNAKIAAEKSANEKLASEKSANEKAVNEILSNENVLSSNADVSASCENLIAKKNVEELNKCKSAENINVSCKLSTSIVN